MAKAKAKNPIRIADVITRVIAPIKKDRSFWQKETTLFKKLFEKYPNIDFWKKAAFKQVPSFAIYLSTEAQYVFLKYQEFLFQPEKPPEEQKILAEKVGADYYIEHKSKSVKDFLS